MRRAGVARGICAALMSLLAAGCGGGGGDSDPLGTDACGVIGLPSKIANGTACGNISNSPVVRVVLLDSSGKQAFCSATMLTAQTALTAAHCITIARPVRVFILYGEPLEAASYAEADSWQTHPNYRPDGAAADVALLHLPQPLNLPTLPVLTSSRVHEGDVVAIFGYGEDETGQFDFQELESGQMRVSEVTQTYIRADYDGEGSDTCLGDSGGPLVKQVDGLPALAGVTSSGTSAHCEVGDRSYFSNLQDPAVLQFLQAAAPGMQSR